MRIPSNLYAEKVFSEHPLVMWALDDVCDYVSLLTPSQKKLIGFTVSGGSSPTLSTALKRQVEDSPLVSISGDSVSNQITITSDNPITTVQALDQTKNSISLSTYFYSLSPSIMSVDIGYQINSETPVFENFAIASDGVWTFLNATFDISSNYGTNGNIKIIYRINLSAPTAASFYFNGLTFGQWSETFNGVSSGVIPQELTSIIEGTTIRGVEASAYGNVNSPAYYVASTNALFAVNEGFPIVYGASSVTRLYQNEGPSLIIPGNGFLHNDGRYKELTLEFWSKIANGTSSPQRILGPLESSDGLYVDGGSLVLKVDKTIASYFLDEFDRPMLINIVYAKGYMKVLLNGEQIIYMEIDNSSVPLTSASNWLGFYVPAEVENIEIDAVAIYPYVVPNLVAKRRFVYGQGVDYPASSTVYGVSSAVIDYSVSEYTNNFSFPDMAKWSSGIVKNAEVNNGTISTPSYTLPDIVINNQSYDSWIASCKTASQASDTKWISISSGHILYNNLKVLKGKDKLKKVFGYFRKTSTANQTLFYFKNKVGDSVSIDLVATGILYTYSSKTSQTTTIQKLVTINSGDIFVAGLDFSAITSYFGGSFSKFFGKIEDLSMYVANNDLGTSQFTGDIFAVSFGTDYQYNENTDENGVIFSAVSSVGDIVPETSYTLYPTLYVDTFVIDIYAKSLWQDFVPLSYFGKYIKYDTNTIYTLDFLQINMDLPIRPNTTVDGVFKKFTNANAYASIQYLSTGANARLNTLTTVPANAANVVIPDESWSPFKKYEILDNTIMYLPLGIDFKKMGLALYVELETNMAIRKPVNMKSLQIASQAMYKDRETKINTKFGIKLSPYLIRGIYNDFSARNPISIYKGSTPYMYLTKKSGIELRGGIFDETSQRGIRVEVNQERAGNYRVGAMQALARLSDYKIPSKATEIFYIKTLDKTISFYVEPTDQSRSRGRIYAINRKTGLSEPGIALFLNGQLVKDAYIMPNQWNMIGIQFIDSLNFDNFAGYIGVTGPMVFNNISNYKHTSAENASSLGLRTWNQLSTVIDSNTIWQELLDQTTWGNVLYVPTNRKFLISPAAIFNGFVGTDKLIISDDNVLTFKNYSYKTFKDIEWDSRVISAV